MSTNEQNNIPEEIDLGVLLKKIKGFFNGISYSIFEGILFVKKNLVFLSIVVLLGIGVGTYVDLTNDDYKTKIIVNPNFGSVDYLYSKIDLLSSKLNQKDYAFFRKIGIQSPEKISMISIEPVIDIYNFVNNNTAIATNASNTQNFEVVKLLAESSGDINKVIKDKLTSKNYPLHTITLNTDGSIDEKKVVIPILNYLNDSDYYDNVRKESLENVVLRMNKNQETVSQIDAMLNEFSLMSGNKSKSNNLIYYNENTHLNELISTKNTLVKEIADLKLSLINLSSTVKEVSEIINIKESKGLNGKMKSVLPVILLFLVLFIKMIASFYKRQKAKI